MVASTHHESRGARRAENGHVLINLQRHIRESIAASCIHAYLAPSLLPKGADTCHACNKCSNQPRGATMSIATGEGEAANTALPLRQILLTSWKLLSLLPISLDTRTDRGTLTECPSRLPTNLAHTILLLATKNTSCFGQAFFYQDVLLSSRVFSVTPSVHNKTLNAQQHQRCTKQPAAASTAHQNQVHSSMTYDGFAFRQHVVNQRGKQHSWCTYCCPTTLSCT